MIIKILSSAKNFSGVNYNERKNDLGESELLCAANFEGLSYQTDLVRADYLNYMKAICSLNTRVKNKQFHAVISAKGKTTSVNKLTEIGVQYLDKMGYGKNPYLIYHHGDTDNSHIHLVTTRVDKNGRKVDDRFEKLRSQKVMHEILCRDPLYETDMAISKALKYNFTTEAQFKLLLELQGFKVRKMSLGSGNNPEAWDIIKYSQVQRNLDLTSVRLRMEEYKTAKQRISQLKAIFSKYALGQSEAQWIGLMKDKIGIDLVFHRKHGYDIPYGYTIADHPKKNVFKGSQVMRLSDLFASVAKGKVIGLIEELAGKPGLSFQELQLELAKVGLSLNQKGNIPVESDKIQLPLDLYNKLRYADRLDLASTMKINDAVCKSILGKLFRVKPSDISSSIALSKDVEAIQAVVAYLDHHNRWKEGLVHYKFKLLHDKGKVFLFAPLSSSLLRLDTLLGKSVPIEPELILDVNKLILKQDHVFQHSSKDHLLSALLEMMAESQLNVQDQRKKRNPHKSTKL